MRSSNCITLSAMEITRSHLAPNPDCTESMVWLWYRHEWTKRARVTGHYCDAKSTTFSHAGASNKYGAATVVGCRCCILHWWSSQEVPRVYKWARGNWRWSWELCQQTFVDALSSTTTWFSFSSANFLVGLMGCDDSPVITDSGSLNPLRPVLTHPDIDEGEYPFSRGSGDGRPCQQNSLHSKVLV